MKTEVIINYILKCDVISNDNNFTNYCFYCIFNKRLLKKNITYPKLLNVSVTMKKVVLSLSPCASILSGVWSICWIMVLIHLCATPKDTVLCIMLRLTATNKTWSWWDWPFTLTSSTVIFFKFSSRKTLDTWFIFCSWFCSFWRCASTR